MQDLQDGVRATGEVEEQRDEPADKAVRIEIGRKREGDGVHHKKAGGGHQVKGQEVPRPAGREIAAQAGQGKSGGSGGEEDRQELPVVDDGEE